LFARDGDEGPCGRRCFARAPHQDDAPVDGRVGDGDRDDGRREFLLLDPDGNRLAFFAK